MSAGTVRAFLPRLSATLKDFRKTAYHHYGNHPLSLVKFLYYSGLRVNTFIVCGMDLSGIVPAPAFAPGFRVVKPSLEELERARSGQSLTREFHYDRILGLKTCYLVFQGEALAYIHWVVFKGEHSRFLILGDRVAELNYNTTIPEFRGNRLQANTMLHICRDLQELGYRRVCGVIHELNTPSLRAAQRAGWRELARVRALGPFNRKVALWG